MCSKISNHDVKLGFLRKIQVRLRFQTSLLVAIRIQSHFFLYKEVEAHFFKILMVILFAHHLFTMIALISV